MVIRQRRRRHGKSTAPAIRDTVATAHQTTCRRHQLRTHNLIARIFYYYPSITQKLLCYLILLFDETEYTRAIYASYLYNKLQASGPSMIALITPLPSEPLPVFVVSNAAFASLKAKRCVTRGFKSILPWATRAIDKG